MRNKNTTLDDLAAIVGFTATVKLSMWFGSKTHNLYVPQVATEDHLLAKLIGLSAMRRLVMEFGGGFLSVPGLHGVFVEGRNSLIRDRLLAGVGTREIAAETGLTERRVLQLRREFEHMGLLPLIISGKMPGDSFQQNDG